MFSNSSGSLLSCFLSIIAASFLLLILAAYMVPVAHAGSVAYVRYEAEGKVRHGILNDTEIEELSGGLFPVSQKTGKCLSIKDVRLLPPTDARKVFAVGMNFASHLASSSHLPPPLFLKLPSSLIGSGNTIVLPKDASNVHFEGELVLVIGKQAKNVSEDQAKDFIFGFERR